MRFRRNRASGCIGNSVKGARMRRWQERGGRGVIAGGDRRRERLWMAALLGTTLMGASLAPGAAVAKDDEEEDSWSQAISEKMKDSISAATSRMGLNKPPGPAPSEAPSGCPTITLLPGTESQRVMAPGATGNQGLRYQYTLSAVGRECTISGNRVSIKVGADGRVLLGPMGSAGRFDIPIRVAVFSEAQGKPVESRLFRMGVSVPAGQTSSPFQFVSDNVVVQIPQGRTSEYSIKVGIDGGAKAGDGGGKAKHASRKKRASQETAAAQ